MNKGHNTTNKKFYRDSKHRVLGGVCSGFSNYINIDPLWIRLLALALVLTEFGYGVIIYTILWIIIPKIKSASEKTKIKRKQIVKHNNEKNEKNEKSIYLVKTTNVAYFISNFIKNALKVIIKLITVLCIFIIVIALIVILILLLFGIEILEKKQIIPLQITNSSIVPFWTILLTGILTIGLPIIGLLIGSYKILLRKSNLINSQVKLILVGLWIISTFTLTLTATELIPLFKQQGKINNKHKITVKDDEPIVIKFENSNLLNKQNYKHNSTNIRVAERSNHKLNNRLKLKFEINNDNESYILVKKKSNHDNNTINIINTILSQNNYIYHRNELILKPRFEELENSDLSITLCVPFETAIYFDKSCKAYINNIQLNNNQTKEELISHYFSVTSKGLQCEDCD